MGVLEVRLWFYIVVSVLDWITTQVLLAQGVAIEANPIAASFAHEPLQLLLFKAVLTILVVLTALRLARHRRSLAETGMAVAAALTMFVVACGLATVA